MHRDEHGSATQALDEQMPEPVSLPSPLLVITDRHRASEPLTSVLAHAVRGGARWLRIREPDLGLFEYVSLCHALIEAVPNPRVMWSVRPHAYAMLHTAYPELRLAVHLTERDMSWSAPNASALVGRSVHRDTPGVDHASNHSDYLLLAPVFDSGSKPDAVPLGIIALGHYVKRSVRPVVALGGVSVARVAQCRQAGATAIAVCGGVMEAAEPAESARAYLDAWGA